MVCVCVLAVDRDVGKKSNDMEGLSRSNLSEPSFMSVAPQEPGQESWETGRRQFRRARFQPPNSVSFLALTFYLYATENSPSFSQNSPSLPKNSVSSLFRNITLETVFRPFPILCPKDCFGRLAQSAPSTGSECPRQCSEEFLLALREPLKCHKKILVGALLGAH